MSSFSDEKSSQKKQKIFLSKKRQKSASIFEIKKVRKIESQDLLEISGLETQSSEFPSPSNKKVIEVFNLRVPSFFNDTIVSQDYKLAIEKYNEAWNQFEDKEDRELYLVRKESLFSQETSVSGNDLILL